MVCASFNTHFMLKEYVYDKHGHFGNLGGLDLTVNGV